MATRTKNLLTLYAFIVAMENQLEEWRGKALLQFLDRDSAYEAKHSGCVTPASLEEQL
jgi:hypothetical protein